MPCRLLVSLAFFFIIGISAGQTHGPSAALPNVPSGTLIRASMVDSLSSGMAREGETFQASLEDAITANGQVIFPRGSQVTGSVEAVHPSGRLSDPGALQLTLNSISNGSQTAHITTEPLLVRGESHTKSNVEKIGGAAAVGAIIGAIAGGGKGAAIGAGAGTAAGTGVAAATGTRDAKVETEEILTWTTVAGPSTTSSNSSSTQSSQTSQSGSQSAAANNSQPRSYDDGNAPATNAAGFSARDRRVIRTCMDENGGNLPPGLAKRESLPPGLEKQIQRNGTLPPGLQKRLQSLPEACERQLSPLSGELERVALGNHVLLIDSRNTVLDLFDLQ